MTYDLGDILTTSRHACITVCGGTATESWLSIASSLGYTKTTRFEFTRARMTNFPSGLRSSNHCSATQAYSRRWVHARDDGVPSIVRTFLVLLNDSEPNRCISDHASLDCPTARSER